MKPLSESLRFLAGQFAFFTFPYASKKEWHPFTISSHPYFEGLRITVKDLGDYTKDLHTKISVGDPVLIEGPYGHFSSSYIKEKDQIWIAGGIGITPFLSLIHDVYTNEVKLFWCISSLDEAVYREELDEIKQSNPGFEYHIWSSEESGHLTVDSLQLDNYLNKGYLLCGPSGLKKSIYKGLRAQGIASSNIYDEEFSFR